MPDPLGCHLGIIKLSVSSLLASFSYKRAQVGKIQSFQTVSSSFPFFFLFLFLVASVKVLSQKYHTVEKINQNQSRI